MRCIWCKRENSDSAIEHIIPEALGCPAGFVLAGGLVCHRCNNGLAHLDRVTIDDFDLLLFMTNVPRKKGRPPVISSRGNMVGIVGKTGPEIAINMERFPVVSENGVALGAFGKSKRNINASLTSDGSKVEIKYSTSIGENRKFTRGIYKIGFSSLAYFLGEEIAHSPMFDSIRDFVRHGTGKRYVLVRESGDASFQNRAWAPYKSTSDHFISFFRLAAMEFVVDFSPDHSLFPKLKNLAMLTMGKTGWTWLPSGDNAG